MFRTLALAVLLASAGPAFGLECTYVSAQGDRLTPETGQVAITFKDGSTDTCTLQGNGTGVPILRGVCESGHDWPYFMISSDPAGEPDIVIFINSAWYEHCA